MRFLLFLSTASTGVDTSSRVKPGRCGARTYSVDRRMFNTDMTASLVDKFMHIDYNMHLDARQLADTADLDMSSSSDGTAETQNTLDLRIAAVFVVFAAGIIGSLPPLFMKVCQAGTRRAGNGPKKLHVSPAAPKFDGITKGL